MSRMVRPVSDAEIRSAVECGARYQHLAPSYGRAPAPEAVEREFLAAHRAPWRRELSSARARWYVVAIAPQREYRVQQALRRDGFEVLLPERIVVRPLDPSANPRRKTCKMKQTKGPLLPGYLMARFELDDTTWHRIAETRSVEGLLGANGRPVALRDQDIEKLHALIARHGLIELRADGSVKRDFVLGEAVKIIEDALLAGVWSGREAQYVGVGDNGTIKLQLDILGRPQVLPFSEALVLPQDGTSA